MIRTLNEIEARLTTLGRRGAIQLLRPGARPERIHSLLRSEGLSPVPDVVTLLGWHDGIDTTQGTPLGDMDMFPGFYLLSLDDACANYRAFVPNPRWTAGWLPLFANGGGDFYVVDLEGEAPGSVRHFRIDEADHPVEFPSLAAMADTLLAAFDARAIFVDSRGYLEMDDAAFSAIAAERNPGVEWWNAEADDASAPPWR